MSRILSREEEAELARSNKKVKDYHQAGFDDESSEGSPHQLVQDTWAHSKVSFKDKLVGQIPGAFVQAFDLSDQMDAEVDSDDEDPTERLREGLVAVKLTRETKMRIRDSWSKAIIVKLVGRSMGLNYLHSKLSQLWKPSGRLDCVDLGNDFFLTRFYVKEDLDNVLRNGPWFIGDHFLSLRPWEPFFKPSSANVSLIAVWIRLYQLPIELYEVDILRPIGEAIGKVLRIDSHTAMEARGKYARLCVQIDVNKPLVDTILIGKFEQAVSYEGIHKLCFICGRVGHRKEACPYVIHSGKPPAAAEEVNKDEPVVCSHNLHETYFCGESHAMPKVSGAKDTDRQYGP